ncbi:MAG: hypothetical protein GY711_30820 [bacterium]|nr:hypothetical protein [bacterium]
MKPRPRSPRFRHTGTRASLAALILCVPIAPVAAQDGGAPAAGAPGGPGLAVVARKLLTAEFEGRTTVDNGVLLVRDGKIEAVGARGELTVPDGYEVLDLGGLWVAPGMIDLHCHVAGALSDLNDVVYLTNPGLRATPTITPGNPLMKTAVAGGVTSVLLIPGSGSNMGGHGILLRSGFGTFEENLLRDPGSLKLAQAGNPERRAPWFPGRAFMNYNTRGTFVRGLAYAAGFTAAEKNGTTAPAIDPQYEIFRHLADKRTQVSTHTQMYQVVMTTITMVRQELGLDVYIDHGTFDGYLAGELAEEADVPAILGPRQVYFRSTRTDGKIQGVAAGYEERGLRKIGFNTDSIGRRGIGQEELSLQAAMGVRYGYDNSDMGGVRGVTSVPALASGLAGRVGALTVGLEADLIVITGDPIDPRTSVEMVFQVGQKVYDAREGRRW